MKIAFQGEMGANSHLAIVEAYPDATPLPCDTFEDALAAISSGESDLGMIPIENSVAGRVADIHHLLPQADLQIVTDVMPFFATDNQAGLDGLAFAAERGSAWTLMYPRLAVVIPEPDLVKVPLAYPIGAGDQAFARFINTWIELKRKDGTLDGLFKYRILGQDAAPKQPRWSILRNVLHWSK